MVFCSILCSSVRLTMSVHPCITAPALTQLWDWTWVGGLVGWLLRGGRAVVVRATWPLSLAATAAPMRSPADFLGRDGRVTRRRQRGAGGSGRHWDHTVALTYYLHSTSWAPHASCSFHSRQHSHLGTRTAVGWEGSGNLEAAPARSVGFGSAGWVQLGTWLACWVFGAAGGAVVTLRCCCGRNLVPVRGSCVRGARRLLAWALGLVS